MTQAEAGKEQAKRPGIEYEAADGQKVALSLEVVKKYLVQGKGDLVTMQEFMYFVNICRARRLNPLTKDCYLIKYSEKESAAIVTSIDFFRKRARAQKDCQGWQVGLLLQAKDGTVKKSHGLVMEDEKLLGAWFEGQPTGWSRPFYKEFNLKTFIKRTREGEVTKFWAPENQPLQIMKVAESQGLRTLWPDEFQQIFGEEEIIDVDHQLASGPGDGDDQGSKIRAFEEAIPEGVDLEKLDHFLKISAKYAQISADELKAQAGENMQNFLAGYAKWLERQPKPEEEISRNPVADEESKSEDNGEKRGDDFLRSMDRERSRLGDKTYLMILGNNGYESADQIKGRKEKVQIYKIMAGYPVSP